MKLTVKVGLQVLIVCVVVMATHARRMNSKEIVDALMGVKSPQSSNDDDVDRDSFDRRVEKRPDVRAHLIIYPDPNENKVSKSTAKKVSAHEQLPFLSHALDVLAAMRMSTHQGTKNVLRTAFPSLFEPDR